MRWEHIVPDFVPNPEGVCPVYAIDIYESEFANHFFAEPEHPAARAIRVHEMRKAQPGFENRGFFKATRRWFHARLHRLYTGVR